ncbi:MAG: protein phosphatase 2C domain-containing protein [Clostridiales bacterium]|nr:protein phosphatase 2C domain-containing protein [Clostridiales bacterium]
MCKIGGREYNQDFLASSVNADAACFVVCDGLGSYIGSEVASRLCATRIIEQFDSIRALDPARAVKREYCESYVTDAHNFVCQNKERNPKIASSCTTVACVATDFENTTILHIGDTRVYYFAGGRLAYQSTDHSLAQTAVDKGDINLRDVRTHKDQNKLTRVLGSDYFIPPDVKVLDGPLRPGDAFILCSDGLWEYVYEEEMEADLAAAETPDGVIEKMERRLLQRISKYNDNYSVIAAMVVD